MPEPGAIPVASSGTEKRAALLSLGLSIFLLVVKFIAYFLTHSNAIFSDAVENIVNVVGSAFALYSITLAHRPADKEHPYGHGKVEFFSAGLEGGMMLLAAVLIAGKVASALLIGQSPIIAELGVGLLLMTIACLLNCLVGALLWQIGTRTGSLTLVADGTHLFSDAVDSAVVLGALLLVRYTGWKWIDSVAALLVAGYIAYLSYGLIRKSAAGLMDEQDAASQKLLRKILDSHLGPRGAEPRICSYHKVRHRHNGRWVWVDFHIMVPAWWNVQRGHRAASAIEYEIEQALGESNATAHVEPCATADCANCSAEQAAVP
ncbi:MAG: cation diffusion facilitator family transporter [Tepidisphaeraceae bacterium]|jgi:cation diffusion facilitator family transporter